VRGGGGVGGPSLGRVRWVWPWEEDEQGQGYFNFEILIFSVAVWPGEDWTPKSDAKMII